mgnify:CR=1 FL=1
MKLMQIFCGFCHYDMTPVVANLDEVKEKCPPDVLVVEAPDYVFEGWGYDETQEGDARFIKPTPPEGWLYDDATGSFYPEDSDPPEPAPTLESLKAENTRLKAQLKLQSEQQTFLEDCILEMADVVYA